MWSVSISFSQIKKLQDYIEKGHNYQEICKKADKLIRKNKLEDESYREGEYRKKGPSKEFLDDQKLKFERWKWYWRDRLTDDGRFPDLQRQWNLYNQVIREAGINERSVAKWKHEGPVKNSGGYWGMGRTSGIAFHPTINNIFYVASPNGGLWKTINNGVTYESIADNLPYQPVGIVIVDPKAPNTLYITLGEREGWWQYSMGVYKSNDGGISWNPTGLNWKLTENKVIYALEMNPKNSSILIAATNDGLYKTWNGGNSWSKIRTENFSDVKYKPGDTSIVYVATNDYWGESNVLKSTDGGNSFNKVSDFALQKVFLKFAVTNADPSFVGLNMSVDGAKKFYLSKNNAQTFEYVSDMPENLVLYFSQGNKNILYCGYVVIYKSYDGGRTWSQITDWWNSGNGHAEVHADHHFIAHHPNKQDEIYFCCDGGVYRYHENTNHWDELVNGLAITQFYKLAISSTSPPVIIGGSQDNGGWIRRFNGSWGNTNGGDAMSQVIDPGNSNIGYTEYWGGNAVYRTTNGFNDLDDITQNIGAELPGQWVTPFSLNPKNPKTFIIGYNEIFVSHDRCNSFKKITNNLTGNKDNDLREVKISPVDTQLIVATRGNIIYSSKDFGKTWKTSTLITTLEITGLEFHPKDTNRFWCTRGGYGAIKVMSTKDRGTTWTNITKNFVNTPVSCIIFDESSNTLFAGTDFGVFFSDADNVDWQYYGTGLPHTTVTDLKIHKTLRKLFISTYGRGFYSIDLPDCAPAVVKAKVSIDKNQFLIADSIKICLGAAIHFKAPDGLIGSFRWRGPAIDTTIIDFTEWNAGIFHNINKTGNYILEYTSTKGCVRLDTIYIKVFSRPNFKLQLDHPHLDCNFKNIELKPSIAKDTLNYTYEWLDPDGNRTTSYQLSGSKPGTYFITLKNLTSQCTYVDSIEIIKYPNPQIDLISLNHNPCFGESTGSISVEGASGRPPYQYNWSDQSSNMKNDYLKAGTYFLSVSDFNQCVAIDTFEIKQAPDFDVSYIISASSGINGSIEIDVKGATPPFVYEWKNASAQIISNAEDVFNLPPGIYDLKIEDSNNCTFFKYEIEVEGIVSNSNLDGQRYNLYPNPANDFLIIETRNAIDDISSLQCFDVQGMKVSVDIKRIDQKKIQLDVSQLHSGEYMIRWINQTKMEEIIFTKM